MRLPMEKFPIEKLRMSRDEILVAMVTAVLVGACEKIGEKLLMGVFWFGLASLKFVKNRMLVPMVRGGEKILKERLAFIYKEPIKPVVNKCSGGFFYFSNSSLFWAVQSYTAPPPAEESEFQETKPGKDENSGEQKETKPREENNREQKHEE